MTRTPQTDAARAEYALGVAQRKVNKTEAKLADARKLIKDLEAELVPLVARRDFLASDPALPQDETPDDEPEPTMSGDDDAEQLETGHGGRLDA